ncbi:MAG: hypothetical protein OXC46_04510 [Thaumarchaeota archaeon]|nr:hypothetical protein [Nitrososphaerota archaeon]
MAKITVGIRIDPTLHTELSNEAKSTGKSLTDIVGSTLANGHKAQFLEQELAKANWELAELKRMTAKRIPKTKRLTVGLTADEYRIITEQADDAHISRAELARQMLTQTRPRPQTQVDQTPQTETQIQTQPMLTDR